MKKIDYTVADLDRVVKFLDGLNKLAAVHKVGLTSYEDIVLTMDERETPFALASEDDSTLSLVVSV